MNIEFKGQPLSVILPIPDTPKPGLPRLWLWSPWEPDKLTRSPANQLIAEGWIPSADQGNITSAGVLQTQLYETLHQIIPESQSTQLWYKSDSPQEPFPVVLAFSIPDTIYDDLRMIPLLSPFPLPQMGEYAFIANQDNSLTLYHIKNLSPEAQQRWETLGDMLKALSFPLMWPAFTKQHAIVLDEQASSLLDEGSALAEASIHIENLRNVLQRENLSHLWQEVQRMARELAEAYYLHHQSNKAQVAQSLPKIVNVFQEGISEVFTGLPFQAYPDAVIARKATWEEIFSAQEHEVIIAHSRVKPGGTTTTQVRGDATGKDREIVLADLRAQVNKLSDLHSDIYWAMVAQLVKGPKDEGGNTWISVQQLLAYRGIEPIHKIENGHQRPAGHRMEDKFDYSQIISSMENTWIKVSNMEIIDNEAESGKDKKRGRSRITRESRLFMFGDIVYHQELSLDGEPGRRYPIAWQYRASNWMFPFLDGPYRFVGVLLEKTLNYDPHNEFWEKRLAKYFMIYLRTQASKHNRPIKIQELFDECNLITDERNPQRTRDRFEKAMNTMLKDGHLQQWDYQENMKALPARRWLATWMNYHIVVENAQRTEEPYNSIRTHAQALRLQVRSQSPGKGKKQGKNARGRKS